MTKNLLSFFRPQSVGVVGVSENPGKLGSQIFRNILEANFSGEIFGINPKFSGKKFGEIFPSHDCINATAKNIHLDKDIPENLDLLVVVTPAFTVENIVTEAKEKNVKNIIVISAGFGEVGHHDLEEKVIQICEEAEINLLGPNCLGAIFPYANLNASFANGYPEKGNICFVSQSGAFCTAMLDWAGDNNLGFSHFISLGNKAGISEDEILENLADDDQVEVFAFYLESIKNPDKFLELIRKVSPHKPIIILEPGESEKASQASASHTGSLAPNYKVLKAAYKAAGAIQVTSMRDMFAVMQLIHSHPTSHFGENFAVVTNAGGVGVLSSDLSAHFGINLPDLSAQTQQKLQAVLPDEAATTNPVDIIGDAKADRYASSLAILSEAPEVDGIFILLTPQTTTEPKKTAEIILDIQQKTHKPLIPIFIGGASVHSGLAIFKENNLASFLFPEEAMSAIAHILHRNQNLIRCEEAGNRKISEKNLGKISIFLSEAREKKLSSLPAEQVDFILESYGLDMPKTCDFLPNALEDGQDFAANFFTNGQKLVAKISSPETLHKTEMQGVILGIDSTKTLKNAWEILASNIEKHHIPMAKIQLQEMVSGDLEIFAGSHTDDNFGKVLVFGSGGIYTEIYEDTSLRVLPVFNEKCLSHLVDETRAGTILRGTRGKKFPRGKVISALKKLEQLTLDFPEIASIDCNPILVSEDRVVFVDVKVVL